MKQSKLLTKFYRAWDDQLFKLNSGKKTKYWFDPSDSLISSLEEYLAYIDKGEKYELLYQEIRNQFKKAKLDTALPFLTCDDGEEYNKERWVRKHLSRDVKTKFKLK